MKQISIILVAFAMVLGLAQCKKNEAIDQNETVTITLDVKHNNSAKVDVNPTIGTVDFETGDKVYVGSGGKYVGFLTHNGANFVGNITNPTEGQPLQFYFLGNVTPNETLSAGTTEECSVIISDQTEHLPVISCASSFENYVSGVTAYTGHLLNKCALVKFNVTTPSNSPICITGVKNKVTVDFSGNTVTPSMDGEGIIKLPAGAGENVEKWAILLPQEALEVGEEGTIYTEDGSFVGSCPALPAIVENEYLAEGFSFAVNSTSAPVGAINGLFSVSATKKVYFSKGNLQYIGSASIPYWKFAEQQWDCLEKTTGQNSSNQNVDRDLFGWGTSGYHYSGDAYNVNYQPWSTSTDVVNYDYNKYGYGPSINKPSPDLTNSSANYDWGVYNPIRNGGNLVNQWRTLTIDEWIYVFNSRNTSSGIYYVKAQVNGINGVILLPDNWDASVYNLSNVNQGNVGFNSNIISASLWEIFETKGAVFLPAADGRNGNSIWDSQKYGYYWSSTHYENYCAYFVFITESILDVEGLYNRYHGQSVRLVQDYNP